MKIEIMDTTLRDGDYLINMKDKIIDFEKKDSFENEN